MTAALSIKVRDVAGVERADLELQPGRIALVGGLNESGKTSLIEAIAAALTGDALFRISKKKDAGALVHDGAKTGSVTIEAGSASATVSWPSCQFETKGAGAPSARYGPVSIGARAFTDLSDDERRALLIDVLQGAATREDLAAELKHLKEDAFAKVWAMVERDGWDGAHKVVGDKVREAKGAWAEAAGEAWGERKADGWTPKGLDVPRDVTEEALSARVDTCMKAVEDAIANSATSKARVEELKGKIKELDTQRARKTLLEGTLPELRTEVDDLRAKREKLPAPVLAGATFPCPHCGGGLVLRKNPATNKPVCETAPKDPAADQATRERRQKAIDDTTNEIDDVELRIKHCNRELIDIAERLSLEDGWQAELIRIENQGETDVDIEAARRDLAQAEQDLTLLQKRIRAGAIHKRIVGWGKVRAALAPDGVRARVLQERLDEMNALMARRAAEMKLKPVEISADMSVTYGGRPAALNSESGRWRMNLLICCHLVACTESPILLVDRLDILHPAARTAVVRGLARLGVPVIVCQTARAAENLPAMEDSGLGLSYWIEAGKLEYVSP